MEFIQEKVSLAVTESNGQHYLDVNIGTSSESDVRRLALCLLLVQFIFCSSHIHQNEQHI